MKTVTNTNLAEDDSFDQFFNSIQTNVDSLTEDKREEAQASVYDLFVAQLKQLKAIEEQLSFLNYFSGDHDLKEYLARITQIHEGTLIDVLVTHEKFYELLKETLEITPECAKLYALFLDAPEKLTEHMQQKENKEAFSELLLATSNMDLFLTKEILARERKNPNAQREIGTAKARLEDVDKRIKKVHVFGTVNKLDIIKRLERDKIIDISVLVFYYYRLSNEDISTDSAISKIFPDIAAKMIKETKK